MRNLSSTLLALILLAAPASAATLGDAHTGFTADRTLVIDGRRYIGKIWAMPGLERHEQALQGFHPIFLLRAERAIGEAVLPQLKTIVEFVLPPELHLLAASALKKREIGRDTVNGMATTKYAVDETVPEGHAKGTLWLSRDGIPMRLAGSFTAQQGRVSTINWELSHVQIGPQPASLFETPRGYSRLPPEAVAPLLGLRLKSSGR